MKTILRIFILSALSIFLVTGSAMAVGIDISSTVNPNWNGLWDEDTLKGTALYTLYVDDTSQYGANVFEVTFEDDIFASIGTAGLISPAGWSLNHYENPNGVFEYEIAFGGTDLLLPNESSFVSFWVDYTLHSADQYNQGSLIGWAWNEGGPWHQAVSATNTEETLDFWLGGGNPSGGTSTVANPEPATMLLLGSGLIGLGWIGRKKAKKGSRA